MPYQIDYTQFTQYDNLELIAKQVVTGFITGLHKSPLHGFSVEFAEHRQYNPGEPTKHIDWKLYAKTDKLFVKRYEEETNLRCHIIIDNSSSMYFPIQEKYTLAEPNKILFSAYAAAALMQIFKNQRDAVGLSVFSDTLELHTSARGGDSHFKMIYRELEKIIQPISTEVQRRSRVTDTLHRIAEQINKRSMVIIFSDMFETDANLDELMLALGHLKHNKNEVMLFHTYHKKMEEDFGFDNRLYRFVDMETGSELKLHSNSIREYYKQAIGDFFKELTLKCGQYQIDMIPADITKGLDQIMLPYLLKREQTV
jgi:uncharacterized protein (DUF58 family)